MEEVIMLIPLDDNSWTNFIRASQILKLIEKKILKTD